MGCKNTHHHISYALHNLSLILNAQQNDKGLSRMWPIFFLIFEPKLPKLRLKENGLDPNPQLITRLRIWATLFVAQFLMGLGPKPKLSTFGGLSLEQPTSLYHEEMEYCLAFSEPNGS